MSAIVVHLSGDGNRGKRVSLPESNSWQVGVNGGEDQPARASIRRASQESCGGDL